MHLEDLSSKNTSAEFATLPKDEHGEDFNSDFNYVSIVSEMFQVYVERFVTFLILTKMSFFCRYNINIDIRLSGITTK